MSEPATNQPATHSVNATPVSRVAVEPRRAATETHAIGRELRDAIDNASQLTDIIRSATEVICRETKCLALWVTQRSAESGQLQTHPLTEDRSEAESVASVVGEDLDKLVEQTMESGDLNSANVTASHQLFASPVAVGPQRIELVLSACFLRNTGGEDRSSWIMKLGSQAIEQWIVNNELQRTRQQAKLLSDNLSLSSAMDRCESTRAAANCLVNHLRRILTASQVVYCDQVNAQQAKLLAISEVEQFDPHSGSSRTILSAAASCIGESEAVVYGAENSNANPLQRVALDAYCKANRFASCVGIATKDKQDQSNGVLLIANKADSFPQAQLKQLEQFASLHGAHLDVVRRGNLSATELVSERIRSVPKKTWFGNAWKAAAALAVLMCIPWPYRVACDCEIQPVTRRFISAPYTGPLEKAVVQPGEVVTAGQVLAFMDGKQLHLELTGVEAEHQAARRRHASALAQGEVAQSQIARSEMRKLQTRITSLKDQLSRLEIRSPYDGIVVSGDLDKAQGATMEIGQTLFEVAPLDAMLAEVAIPESEIQYAADQQSVAIKLNAFPYRTFYGTVDTINPGAEILGDDSVFVAHVKLDGEQIAIRPGMKGSAKVNTGWSPIGWNLLHNAWESFRCWLVW